MNSFRSEKKKESPFKLFFRQIIHSHLFESAATLSYYFLFSVFPLVIFISTAFSTLHVSSEKINYLQRLIPEPILKAFLGYLSELTLGNTPTLMIIGIVLTLYSLGKALQTMKRKFRLTYEIEPRVSLLREWSVTFIFIFLVLLSFYASLFLIVTGNSIFNFLVKSFPVLEEARWFIRILRYTLVSAFLSFVLFGLYYVLPGIKQKKRYVLPGTLFSLAAWVLASWLFSFYFTHFGSYTNIYGSAGTVIALLSWLFTVNVILLLGANINAFIYKQRVKNKSKEEKYD